MTTNPTPSSRALERLNNTTFAPEDDWYVKTIRRALRIAHAVDSGELEHQPKQFIPGITCLNGESAGRNAVLNELKAMETTPAANTGDVTYEMKQAGYAFYMDQASKDLPPDVLEFCAGLYRAMNEKAALQRPEPGEDIELDDVIAWADGVFSAFGILAASEKLDKPALAPRQVDVTAMAKAYEEEREKYIGGVVYYPHNQAAHEGAMQKALAAVNLLAAAPTQDTKGE